MAGKPKPKPKPKLPSQNVVFPSPYDVADAAAIQACIRGNATPDQQRRAIDWIIVHAAATYDQCYRPERPYDTVFADGRRFVGNEIVKLSKLNLSKLREKEDV